MRFCMRLNFRCCVLPCALYPDTPMYIFVLGPLKDSVGVVGLSWTIAAATDEDGGSSDEMWELGNEQARSAFCIAGRQQDDAAP